MGKKPIDMNKLHRQINQLFDEVLAARLECQREVAALMLYERGRYDESLDMLESIDPEIPMAKEAARDLCLSMILLTLATRKIKSLDADSTKH